jgi:tetratricopeptide (TPR) repeat protein
VVRAVLLGTLLFSLLQVPAVDWRTISLDDFPTDARVQISAARDATRQHPADAVVAGELAIVLHAWEQFELAAQVYAETRRLAPADGTWWALSGTLALRMGRHDLASGYFGRAAAIAPSPLLVLRHADALLESGKPDAARTVYDVAVRMPDAEPAARYGLGRIAASRGDVADAQRQFERAVALVPTFGAAHYALAQVQRKQGDLAAARDSLRRQQQCLACWPIPDDPYTARVASVREDAAALLGRAIRAAAMADDARAIAMHEQVLARNPESLQARTNLITLYARTGNLQRADAEYRLVIASGTQLADAHRAYGLALASSNKPTEALPILTLAAEANPLDAAVQNALGLVHESQRRLTDAEASYRRAAAAAPDVRGFRFNLARTLVNLGRIDDALAQLSPLATPDDAESVRYVYASSALLARQGDIAAARRMSEEALARAKRHDLTDLAATIERDLQKLK